MNKSDKERFLVNIALEEIKSIDKSLREWFYRTLGILGAIGLFIYSVYPNITSLIIVIGYFILIYFAYLQILRNKYIDDSYAYLFNLVKEGKL